MCKLKGVALSGKHRNSQVSSALRFSIFQLFVLACFGKQQTDKVKEACGLNMW